MRFIIIFSLIFSSTFISNSTNKASARVNNIFTSIIKDIISNSGLKSNYIGILQGSYIKSAKAYNYKNKSYFLFNKNFLSKLTVKEIEFIVYKLIANLKYRSKLLNYKLISNFFSLLLVLFLSNNLISVVKYNKLKIVIFTLKLIVLVTLNVLLKAYLERKVEYESDIFSFSYCPDLYIFYNALLKSGLSKKHNIIQKLFSSSPSLQSRVNNLRFNKLI